MCQSSAPCTKSNVDKKRLLEVLFFINSCLCTPGKQTIEKCSIHYYLDIIIFERVINNATCTDVQVVVPTTACC